MWLGFDLFYELLIKILPSFSPNWYVGNGPDSFADSTLLAMPPNNPVASCACNFSPVFKLYVDLQKSHDIRGALPLFLVSSFGGNAFAFVNGILHEGHDELKQNVSPSVWIIAIAPVGFATLSLKFSRLVSINTTLPSFFGNAAVVWFGIICQFLEEPDDAAGARAPPVDFFEDDVNPPVDPISFFNEPPRPRLIDIVDRRVVTPNVEYASDMPTETATRTIRLKTFMMISL